VLVAYCDPLSAISSNIEAEISFLFIAKNEKIGEGEKKKFETDNAEALVEWFGIRTVELSVGGSRRFNCGVERVGKCDEDSKGFREFPGRFIGISRSLRNPSNVH
jgi:hypothetical protein